MRISNSAQSLRCGRLRCVLICLSRVAILLLLTVEPSIAIAGPTSVHRVLRHEKHFHAGIPRVQATRLEVIAPLLLTRGMEAFRAGTATFPRWGMKPNLSAVASSGTGVLTDMLDMVSSAYDWWANLGAPTALVAGAVIATVYENMSTGDLHVLPKDSRGVQLGKRLTRILLMSAFLLEVIGIFARTVPGTVCWTSRTMEYLASKVAFVQGMLNWLVAIALSHFVPHPCECPHDQTSKLIDAFIGSAVFATTITFTLAFYNNQKMFYRNYGHMLYRWMICCLRKITLFLPVQSMAISDVPSSVVTMYFGVFSSSDTDTDV